MLHVRLDREDIGVLLQRLYFSPTDGMNYFHWLKVLNATDGYGVCDDK